MKLSRLAARIRPHRRALRISATELAEAAGMSRVTLHRLERGEPSVTMGAYMSAIALGLELELMDPKATPDKRSRTSVPRQDPGLRLPAAASHRLAARGYRTTACRAAPLFERVGHRRIAPAELWKQIRRLAPPRARR
jgi:transcriptional regulator with XRE-family HTH domain